MSSTASHSPVAPPAFDPAAPLRPSGNLRRRLWISGLVQGGATLASVLGVLSLAIVTIAVIGHGSGVLRPSFVLHDPPQFGGPGGGIASALVGTSLIVALGAVIALPLGLLCALYLVEFAGALGWPGAVLRMTLDMMQGLPTVVIGLFVFGLIVAPEHADSGFAGSVALMIIMLPLIARTSQEVLQALPQGLREASDALGVDRWRSILTVILPSAAGGILTGTILAVARAAGETAPLLIVDGIFTNGTTVQMFGHGIPNIPVLIWTSIDSASPGAATRAWGAALMLLALILIANIGARLTLARSRRRMGL